MKHFSYVIAGVSIAGLSAVRAIRSRDPSGKILLIHGEQGLPYKRTQLSKRIAKGFALQEIAIFPESWYGGMHVELLQGVKAVFLDSSARRLTLDTGEIVRYDNLLIATGAAPTPLAIPGSQHLRYLRWIDQAQTLVQLLKDARQAVSIGFGPLAIELSDQFNSAGVETTMLGGRELLMPDYLDLTASRRLESRVKGCGVTVARYNGTVEVERKNQEFRVVAPGLEKHAQLVTASVGASPVTDLAALAGIPLAADGGIKVDNSMRTEVEGIFAAGDAASPLPGASRGLWHSSEEAGMIAGANMAGESYRPAPRAYRLKCEVFGGYLFSMNYIAASRDDQAQKKVLLDTPAIYLAAWERLGRGIAAVMDLASNPGGERKKLLGKQLEHALLQGVRVRDIPGILGV